MCQQLLVLFHFIKKISARYQNDSSLLFVLQDFTLSCCYGNAYFTPPHHVGFVIQKK